MMDFPISDLMDETACYRRLVELFHPDGLVCPRCCQGDDLHVHRRNRDPVLDYRCGHCRRVFNAFTGTDWQRTHARPSRIILILRGIAQGRSTAGLARELKVSRGHLLERRHAIQAKAVKRRDATPLPDDVSEADEMYQNAGEKRVQAHRSRRPATSPRSQ